MKDNFIENKLNAILQKHTTQTLSKDGKPNTGLRLDLIVKEVYKLGQSHYHNHIVEKIMNLVKTTRHPYMFSLTEERFEKDLRSLLQDTNLKGII